MNTNQWNVILHLSGFVGLFLPFGNLIAPFVIWLLKRESSQEMDRTGKEVLNFQLSYSIYSILLLVFGFLLTFLIIGIFFFFILAVLCVVWIVFIIMAAIKASNGEFYSYPLTIRFFQ